MLSASRVSTLISEGPATSYIFSRAPLEDMKFEEILPYYDRLLKNKPVGAWLVRESRSLGYISTCRRTTDGVEYCRFAYVNGRWCGYQSIPSGHQAIRVDLTNIEMRGRALLAALNQRGFKQELQLFPNRHQATSESIYSMYSIPEYCSIGADAIVDTNPLEGIKAVLARLDTLMKSENTEWANDFPKLDAEMTPAMLEELFVQWIEFNNLESNIVSPISFELMKNPRIISESRRAVDLSDIYDDQGNMRLKACPFSRKPIESIPYQLEGYTDKLNLCLEQFRQLLVKAAKIREETGLTEATVVPSTSPASSSTSSTTSSSSTSSSSTTSPSSLTSLSSLSLFSTSPELTMPLQTPEVDSQENLEWTLDLPPSKPSL